jgi:hypothetical protein
VEEEEEKKKIVITNTSTKMIMTTTMMIMMMMMRNAYRMFVRKSKRLMQLGRLRGMWRDNIEMDIRQIALGWY